MPVREIRNQFGIKEPVRELRRADTLLAVLKDVAVFRRVQDSLAAAGWIKLTASMEDNIHLATWVTRAAREQFAQIARAQGLSESALLRRQVESVLLANGGTGAPTATPVEKLSASGRISVRLRDDDLLLLRERASARRIPTSTYVSYLVRAHLRNLAPIPNQELEALKRSVAEVSAIGRNINQIARAVNEQQWPGGPDAHVLQLMIKVLTAMRERIRELINTNLASWDSGHGKTDS